MPRPEHIVRTSSTPDGLVVRLISRGCKACEIAYRRSPDGKSYCVKRASHDWVRTNLALVHRDALHVFANTPRA